MGSNKRPLIPDVLVPGLHMVFCGTAPSRISFEKRAYYANPGNAFWPTLAKVGLLPEPLTPQRYAELPLHGLGLTDLNKSEYGSDHELSAGGFDVSRLRRKLLRYRPAAVAFTSKTAACHWFGLRQIAAGRVEPAIVGMLRSAPLQEISYFVLSSPSGRARSWWSLEPWLEAARFVAERRGC